MDSNREHPLYYLDAETLLVAIYVWVDDELKALQAQGLKLPRKQRHQKATLAELLTLAIFLLGPGPGQGLPGRQDHPQGLLPLPAPPLPLLSGPAKGPGVAGPPRREAFRGTRPSAGGGPQAHPPGPRPQGPRPLPSCGSFGEGAPKQPPWAWGPWARSAVTC